MPEKVQLYKRFAPEGDAFWNVSVDYGIFPIAGR